MQCRPESPIRARVGYTTIEMVIVAVIIGLMTAVAIPRIGQVVLQERARRGAAQIATQLEYAFGEAARTNKPVIVQYDTVAGLLQISSRSSGAMLRQTPLKAGSDFGFSVVTFQPASQVLLFPTGVASSAITMSVGVPGYSRTITASRTGRIRVL